MNCSHLNWPLSSYRLRQSFSRRPCVLAWLLQYLPQTCCKYYWVLLRFESSVDSSNAQVLTPSPDDMGPAKTTLVSSRPIKRGWPSQPLGSNSIHVLEGDHEKKRQEPQALDLWFPMI